MLSVIGIVSSGLTGLTTVFVDTSAFVALFNDTDKRHRQAKQIWHHLVIQERPLLTTNYVILETTANRRQLSLVDCISFVAMRQINLQTAFVFDDHFAEQGFTVLD